MIAKWYQNDFSASPPNRSLSTLDIPNARVGAPPVREMIESSPTSAAAWEMASGVISGAPSPRPLT